MDPLSRDVHELGRRLRARVGHADLMLVKCLKWTARLAEILGRALLVLLPTSPVAWILGTLSVAYCLSIEAQLNHTIMHGAFARLPNAGRYHPSRYETIANPFRSNTWGDAHHIHHGRPSVLGEDPDTVHPLFRVHPGTPRRFWHRLNTFIGAVFVFECWAIDYDLFLKRAGKRRRGDPGELVKLSLYVGYHFVLFPLLAGPSWGWVLLSAFVAMWIRNGIFTVLQTASSVGANVSTIHAHAPKRLRGDPYVRFQVESSKNFKLDPFSEVLCGGLDRHIEHHLFPALPPNLLPAASREVRVIAARHGVRYEEHASVWRSLADSFGWLAALAKATPPKGGPRCSHLFPDAP
ncbi:MAG: fatty acid desaturase [Polyangiaceae bacterium]